MLKNYFKIAWRNLNRNRGYTFINVAGLSLSIACGLLIFTLINYHLSFDAFHKNKDRIYRVVTELHNENIDYTPGVPPPFAKTFRSDFPDAEKVARVISFGNSLISITSEKEIKKFEEENGIACAESEFFEILDFPLVQGDIKTALSEPNTALITQKMAKKYFGTDEAMGRTFLVNNKTTFKITGILKNLPFNTDRRQEIYVSNLSMKDLSPPMMRDRWGGIYSETHCFVLLKPGIKATTVESFFVPWLEKYYPANKITKRQDYLFKMQPLSDLHFNPNYNGIIDKKYLWALVFIGIFLIITACVNFINLATAQALSRAKEVGIRKVLGSLRFQLFWQFITETSLITLLAVCLGFGLAELGLPYLNQLLKTELNLNFFNNFTLPIFVTLLFIVVVFLSGAYPGLVLSGFQPVTVLKGKLSQASIGGFSLRKLLVVTQFAISQMLIIGTIVIASQMKFIKKTDLGFSKEAIIMLPIPANDSIGKIKMEALRNKLSTIAGVENVSLCMEAPASEANNSTNVNYDNNPKDELWEVNNKNADNQYLATFGLKLVSGRNLYPSDTVREFLVNETFVKKLNLASPQDIINKSIQINRKKALVVGVVKNFYNKSFHQEADAVVIASNNDAYDNCAIKINMASHKTVMLSVEKAWNQIYPEYLYKYQFLDDRIAKFYELDETLLKLIEVFACIAIFIGCLGLYGLVSFMALRKTKEIGVRKVLGADVINILWLFGKEFSKLLLIAFLIAAPSAWWAMHKYLLDFKYRINIGIEIFLMAILFTFIIAAITVSYQSFKASFANPVKSLRTE